jgi:hypothetical protein
VGPHDTRTERLAVDAVSAPASVRVLPVEANLPVLLQEAFMEFSKASSMLVLLAAVLETVAICVVCYFVGGGSHAVPQ